MLSTSFDNEAKEPCDADANLLPNTSDARDIPLTLEPDELRFDRNARLPRWK